jgi:hypothetical protein
MNKLTTILIFAGLAFGAGPARVYTGVVTDSMCKMDHKAMKVAPDEKCVQECAKAGSKYVLAAADGKTYGLSDQAVPAKFAAKKVTVSGELDTKTGVIRVVKIEAAK